MAMKALLGRLSRFAMVAFATCSAVSAASGAPTQTYEVVRVYPRDPGAFTEGLMFMDGALYESTGLYGRSSIRKVDLETGAILQQVNLPPNIFGEGLASWHSQLINLTWKSQIGFVFGAADLKLQRTFRYRGEGWGLASSKHALFMSDGTAQIRVLDPNTLREVRRIDVTDDGKPISQLNELEWVEGELFANVWQTDRIARIDPATGLVKGWIDLAGLLGQSGIAATNVDVLNGIAYDPARKRLLVTGKLWPSMFEIRVIDR